jgi:hypothetical protein
MNKFENNLKNVIKQLPQYEPKTVLWKKIEWQLKFRNKLKETVQQLPVVEPSEFVWTNIENSLNEVHRSYKTKNLIIGLTAAASIALLIGIYLFNKQYDHETISITEETVSEWSPASILISDTTTQNAIRFIEDQCRNKTYVCNLPGFDEKKLQLMEINDQINELDLVIQSSGGTSTIVKSRIKLENLRTKLLKDLLNQIAS